jgi:hypothetical protein
MELATNFTIERDVRDLSFQNLYDDYFVVIIKPRSTWEGPEMIFAEGFTPELGKRYSCVVHRTSATFVFDEISYHRSTATLEHEASVLDKMNFMYGETGQAIPDRTIKTSLASALPGLAIIRGQLPKRCEIVKLIVQPDLRNGGLMFAPHYLDIDPRANGKPSMRFFYPIKEMRLEEGMTYRGRVKDSRMNGRVNRQGAVIVDVKVDILAR